MKDIPVRRGRRYIAALTAQGEHDRQDFKYAISDARKIARSVSAFANAAGGRLLIGVKDNGAVAGVRNEEDVYVVEQAAERYCDPPQAVEFMAYSFDTGVTVIEATISPAESRPVRVIEEDGRLRAYCRVADENIAVHPLMVRAWSRSGAVSVALDGDATRLVDLLRSPGDVRPEDVAVALGLSRRTANALIVDLAAMGVVTFRYSGGRWLLSGS